MSISKLKTQQLTLSRLLGCIKKSERQTQTAALNVRGWSLSSDYGVKVRLYSD